MAWLWLWAGSGAGLPEREGCRRGSWKRCGAASGLLGITVLMATAGKQLAAAEVGVANVAVVVVEVKVVYARAERRSEGQSVVV